LYGAGPILYFITGRTQLATDEPARQRLLLERIAAAALAGCDFIQLREKDLPIRDLEALAVAAVKVCREASTRTGTGTRLLVNSRADVAIAAGAAGVHLPKGELGADAARSLLAKAGMSRPVVAVSCHSLAEVRLAESQGADFAVFGPAFEKDGNSAAGMAALEAVCRRTDAAENRMPVLALGGVTLENARDCLRAGAAGVAGIRLFQNGDVAETVSRLRSKNPMAADERG
jgi:thiamine-phosphate pyrophosphorylase